MSDVTRAGAARVPYRALTVIGVAIVVCGSLTPFDFETVRLADAIDRIGAAIVRHPLSASRSDTLANVLLMMPVAFCAAGAVLRNRATFARSAAAVAGIAAAGAALSVAMELIQLGLPTRVVSMADVYAETFGSIVGALGWLWAGPRVTAPLDSALAAREPLTGFERAMLACVALALASQLMPFDLSLEPTVILHKYREGRLVTWTPPGSAGDAVSVLWAAAGALRAVPIGLAAGLLWRPRGHRRSLPVAAALGVTAVGAVELGHLFIESRAIDVSAAITGAIGVAIGVWLVRWLSVPAPVAPVPVAFVPVLACVAWTAVIVWSQWYPFNFTSDRGEVVARLRDLASWSSLTIGAGRAGALTSAFLLTVPLGVGVRSAIGSGSRVPAVVVVCCVTAVLVLWCGVEFGRALLPAGAPDLAQLPMATCGAAAGLWLGRVRRPGDSRVRG